MFYYILTIFILVIILSEKNRQNKPKTKILNYYTNKSLFLGGLINSLIKLHNKKYIFNTKNLNLNTDLINNHDQILNEFKKVYKKNKLVNPGLFSKKFKQNDDKYGYFYINYYGYIKNNKFPSLTKILKKYKNVQSAFYSVIDGKKNIHKHKGPYCGIIRYHYTLISSNTKKDYLKVKKKKLYWFEKNSFMFDDTYQHYLKKTSKDLRVALIIDIKRNDLPIPLDFLNNLFLNYLKNTNYVKEHRIKLEEF